MCFIGTRPAPGSTSGGPTEPGEPQVLIWQHEVCFIGTAPFYAKICHNQRRHGQFGYLLNIQNGHLHLPFNFEFNISVYISYLRIQDVQIQMQMYVHPSTDQGLGLFLGELYMPFYILFQCMIKNKPKSDDLHAVLFCRH